MREKNESKFPGDYSHDGIRDTLTHLAAPPYFYANLRREISLSIRSGRSFSLVRFVIKNSESIYEEVILSFSEILRRNFREEDLIARMGMFEFVILFKSEATYVEQLCQRLIAHWGLEGIPDVAAGYSFITFSYLLENPRDAKSSLKKIPLQLLNDLDGAPLTFPSI